MGITTRDVATNDLLPTYEILEQLSKSWKTMSNAQQVSLGTTLAGVNQYKVFAAIMNNFDQAVKATNESMNSSGATARQNAVYMKSLEAKVQALKTEFEKLVLGDGGLQNLAKTLVDIGTAFLKLANSEVGQAIIKIVALTASFVALSKVLTSIGVAIKGLGFINLIADTMKLQTALASMSGVAITSTQAFSASMKVLTQEFVKNAIAWASTPMGMATIAIASIVGIVYAMEKANVTLEEQVEILNEAKQAYQETESEIEGLEKKLEEIRDRISEINKEGRLEITTDNELRKLKEEEAVLENQLRILKEKAELQKKEYTEEANKTLNKQVTDEGAFGKTNGKTIGVLNRTPMSGSQDSNATGTPTEALKKYTEQINSAQMAINSMLATKQKMIESGNVEQGAIDSINRAINEEIAKRDSARESAQNYANTIQDAVLGADQNSQAVKEANSALDEYSNVIGEVKDTINELTMSDEEFIDKIKETNELTEEQSALLDEEIAKWLEEGKAIEDFDFDGFLNGLDNAVDKTEEAVDWTKQLTQAQTDLSNAMSNLTNMGSNYDTLTNAMNEFNNSGVMSLDTLSKLTALGSDWISILETENGVMSISEEGLKNLANSYIDDAEAKAYDKAIAELYATAENEATVAKNAGAQASNVAVTASRNAGNAIQASGIQAQNAATQWANAWNAVSQGSIKISQQAANNINKTLQTTINTLEKQRNAINKNVKAISSGTKATKSNSGAKSGNTNATKSNTSAVDENTKALQANIDALKKQKEALEKEIEEDEKVISIISKKLDEEIEKVEKIRDEEIEEVKRQQEERKKLYEDQIERIDDEIDALEKKKKAEEDYYNEQIDNLKKQNEALEDQLELEKLLQNLENAKNKKTRVYRKGKGFVYETDQDEVNKAQKELDEYYRKKALADQIQQLEDARDSKSKIYDEEIDDLKKYKEQIQRQYEIINDLVEKEINEINDKYQQNIDQLKALKDEFVKMTKAYETELGNQLVKQKTGIDLERDGWTERLRNLSSFVDSYNKKQKELNSLTETLNGLEAQLNSVITKQTSIIENQNKIGTTVGTNTGGGTQTPSTPGSNKTNYRDYTVFGDVQGNPSGYTTASEAGQARKDLKLSAGQYYTGIGSNGKFYIYRAGFMQKFSQQTTSNNADRLAQEWATGAKSVNGISIKGTRCFSTQSNVYATGVSSVGENQFAVVGDSPTNRELVIGSHLNGTAMQLQKGSGVVNAKSTNTLAGLLNHLGSFSGSNFGGGNGVLSNMSNTESMYIDKVVIEGSNITDVVSFKNSLMNLKSEATQRAYRHK